MINHWQGLSVARLRKVEDKMPFEEGMSEDGACVKERVDSAYSIFIGLDNYDKIFSKLNDIMKEYNYKEKGSEKYNFMGVTKKGELISTIPSTPKTGVREYGIHIVVIDASQDTKEKLNELERISKE